MNIKRILFPTDFSKYNNAALKYASTLAAESGALLFIVYVDESLELSAAMGEAGYLGATWARDSEQQARGLLTKIVPSIPQVKYEHRWLTGHPVTELLNFADQEHIDLIVMGSHGRTGLSRLLIGSIAEGVMRKAKCPVLVVKQPQHESESAATTITSSSRNSG